MEAIKQHRNKCVDALSAVEAILDEASRCDYVDVDVAAVYVCVDDRGKIYAVVDKRGEEVCVREL